MTATSVAGYDPRLRRRRTGGNFGHLAVLGTVGRDGKAVIADISIAQKSRFLADFGALQRDRSCRADANAGRTDAALIG